MQQSIQSVKTALKLEAHSALIDFSVQNLQDLLELHLFERVLRVQVKLGARDKFDHFLGPGADRADIQAVSNVDLLRASLDVVKDRK